MFKDEIVAVGHGEKPSKAGSPVINIAFLQESLSLESENQVTDIVCRYHWASLRDGGKVSQRIT